MRLDFGVFHEITGMNAIVDACDEHLLVELRGLIDPAHAQAAMAVNTENDAALLAGRCANLGACTCVTLISEAFASLPTLIKVICSVYSQRRGRKTATTDDEYLLSVLAMKLDWQKIDCDAIDQLDLFHYLGGDGSVRRMTSTGVFKPAKPIEPDDGRFS